LENDVVVDPQFVRVWSKSWRDELPPPAGHTVVVAKGAVRVSQRVVQFLGPLLMNGDAETDDTGLLAFAEVVIADDEIELWVQKAEPANRAS
jgi:hypothetical protein